MGSEAIRPARLGPHDFAHLRLEVIDGASHARQEWVILFWNLDAMTLAQFHHECPRNPCYPFPIARETIGHQPTARDPRREQSR